MKSKIKLLTFLFLSLNFQGISQIEPSKLSFKDSLINSVSPLSENFIKIQYVGTQDYPLPVIFIENTGRPSNPNDMIHSCSADRIINFFVTYKFSLSESSYQYFQKWMIENIRLKLYARISNNSGAFEICFKTKNQIDTIYANSLQFLEDLKHQFHAFNNPCYLWIIPAIDELEFYSKSYIEPEKFNKLEK